MPLSGIRVLELGQLIAGPMCGMMLSSFGAEVIKVEPPKKGDPMREWRRMKGDTSLWWYGISRNKKSLTLDLRKEEAQEIIREIVSQDTDVIIENFRPGKLEEWGLGYEQLKKINPKLVLARLSGWGQTGPYSERPGFASVAEGIGGLRYLTGEPGRPPIRSSISLGDTVSGLYAVIGIMNALYHRDAHSGEGQVVDVAIYESVFNLLESSLSEFKHDGHIRERTGSSLPGIVPSNTYKTKDEKFLIIGGNNDSIFKRLMTAVGRKDMADRQDLASNQGRVEATEEIDQALGQWASQTDLKQALEILNDASVPAGPIMSIADICKDPHYHSREMFEEHSFEDESTVTIPRVAPILSGTPAKTKWLGPKLGEHNQEILGELLGKTLEDIESLKSKKII